MVGRGCQDAESQTDTALLRKLDDERGFAPRVNSRHRPLAELLRWSRRATRACRDFFKEIPIHADAYVMPWILHDWSDDESIALLANVRKVATPNARLMVVESVVPETPEFDMGKWMDLNMMVMTTGRERTAAEFRDLLGQAGFALEEIVSTASPLSIVVGNPMA